MWSDLIYRLRALVRRRAVESEMDEELRFHFDRQVEKYVAAGMARAEAERRARMEFGGVESIKEECREARGVMLIETILQDCRYALRMMHRYPAFTAMAIVLVGLGVGASTSMFSLVAASVLRRPQFSDRLVYIWRLDKRDGEMHSRFLKDVSDTLHSIEDCPWPMPILTAFSKYSSICSITRSSSPAGWVGRGRGLHGRSRSGYLYVSVTDSGRGIGPEAESLIFDRLYQDADSVARPLRVTALDYSSAAK